jgi:hypothetical protein
MDQQEKPEDTVRRFARKLVSIEELHKPIQICDDCGAQWPCPTIKLLNQIDEVTDG